MAKKRRATKQDIMQYLRLGGSSIPARFAANATATTESMRRREMDAGKGLRSQGGKLYGELTGASSVQVDDPANKKTLDGLANWHKKLAAKTLPFPKVAKQIGGFFPGRISATIVPPFDFADTIPTVLAGNPQLSVSANVNGQISANSVTSQSGYNGGSEYARVGFFFHPTTEGTLTVRANPAYSFEWATNSLNNSPVTSFGSLGLFIYGLNDLGQILASTGTGGSTWDQSAPGQIQLGYESDLQSAMSISLPVTHSLIYTCFVAIDVHAIGAGWPGSLASAMLAATVASMSYEFDPVLVADPLAN
jgi:hypothetical protein